MKPRSKRLAAALIALVVGAVLAPIAVAPSAEAAGSGLTATGTVALGSAAAKAGAGEVEVRVWANSSSATAPIATGSTDADGTFSISDVPAGYYRFVFAYRGAGPYRTESELYANVPLSGQVNIVIPVAPLIEGTVRLGFDEIPAGAGKVSVELRYAGGYKVTTTDAFGRFSFGRSVAAGTGSLRFDVARDGSYRPWYFSGFGGIGTPVEAEGMRFAFASDRSDYDVTIGGGSELSGIVRDTAGDPVPDITVSALELTGPPDYFGRRQQVQTDASGRFLMRGLRDFPHVLGVSGGGRILARPGETLVDAGEHERTEFDLVVYSAATVRLHVGFPPRNPDPYAFPREAASLYTRSSPSAAWESMTGSGIDELGQGLFENLLPGEYKVALGYSSQSESPIVTQPFTLTEGATVSLEFPKRPPVLFRDISGDHTTDVLARDAAGALRLYSGNGAGGWSKSGTIGTGWGPMTAVIRAHDFSGDGRADVLARNSAGKLVLYHGNDVGTVDRPRVVGSGWNGFTSIFSPGDFDGDGTTDVMARDASGALWLYRGNGSGGWGAKSKVGTGWGGFTSVFGVGDFTGDGNVDVMARDASGRLFVYRGNGVGGWSGSKQVGSGWGAFTAVFGPGDFDGDTKPDVMARDAAGALWLYRGNGSGGWGAKSKVGSGWGSLTIVI